MSTSETDYKVDHLFLLVGENPLPNYIAAKMLLKEKDGDKQGGTVHLVHSTDTAGKADCLERMLAPINFDEFISLGKSEADSSVIRKKIQTRVKKILDIYPNTTFTFGLNYTGGTKAMSVHSYRALFEASGVPDAKFSYLDARSLQMLIDRENYSPKAETVPIKLSLQEIFDLHDLRWESEQKPVSEPILHELAIEFAKLHTDPSLVIAWRWWCDNVLKPATKILKKKQNKPPEWEWKKDDLIDKVTLKPDFALQKLNEALQEFLKQPEESKSLLEAFQQENFKTVKELGNFYNALWVPEDKPHIEKVIKLLVHGKYLGEYESELSLNKMAEISKEIAEAYNQSDENEKPYLEKSKDACRWLDGLWLEHYVLHQVEEISKNHPGLINDSGMSFKVKDAKKEKFEFDVAFVKDYQLFALSCTTDASKGLCKSKLFEAYIRARQLGGDQARVALVCCYNNPKDLEKEMKVETEVDKKDPKIAVFGCKELDNLHVHIKNWIDEINRYYAP
ncbi:DUF1887 family CARF protein [Microcoleus sp. A003_D6]|uniref:Card1-like endonuclease domain-containing protein n=1 Tax=Microcoleus sp. A003_D6 TaxID=3055266 RepID=UPI002FD1387D